MEKGQTSTLFVVLAMLAGLFFVGTFFATHVASPKKTQPIPFPSPSSSAKKSLQLVNLILTPMPTGETPIQTPAPLTPVPTVPTPVPTNYSPTCYWHKEDCKSLGLEPWLTCNVGNIPGAYACYGSTCYIDPDKPIYNEYVNNPNCCISCIGKPVIYLYPTRPTRVDVTLAIPGRITISDPLYQTDGWRGIEAYPDGTLIYKGKTYRELYYESEVNKKIVPKKGIIIKTSELEQTLHFLTTRLGLIHYEQQEFIDYWVPKLTALSSPYIFFSVLTPSEKEAVDHVEITPRPDTTIEFLAYFRPMYVPSFAEPLTLPQEPPKRIGFTAVEWGGTIDFDY